MNKIIYIDGEKENLLDKERFPLIENNDIQDLLLLDTIDDDYREKYFNIYNFYGLGVPRVSEILKETINKEYLTIWAAKIGSQQMAIEKNRATTIGSRVHSMIEHYLTTGEDKDLSYMTAPSLMKFIKTAYKNFKNWVSYIESLGYHIEEIIAIEKPIICPLYGGTIDCILRINGKVYIVDFKTSKQISYEYIIQTCAYMWAVNNGYAPDLPHIDGIGIIRIDKENSKFEDLFLNEYIPEQAQIINHYYNGFGSMLSSFYNNINMKLLFSNYKKSYNINETL